MSLTPQWRPITKRVLDLFGRWGDPRTNLRSMLDGILPVAVVDDFRDDDRGSVFGINAFSLGAPGEHPTISFGSSVNDWELLAITQLGLNWQAKVVPFRFEIIVFTPIFPFNPATTINPFGVFTAGLLLNRSFTFGTVQGIGGAVVAPPAIFGPGIVGPTGVAFPSADPFNQTREMSPWITETPLRIYRDVTLTFMIILSPDPAGLPTAPTMSISLLVRERPKVTTT